MISEIRSGLRISYNEVLPVFTFKEPLDIVASVSIKVCNIARSENALPKSSAS